MVVVIDSGPISAEDRLRDVPREKWRDLMVARRYFMRTRLSHDCRCLVGFVEDAKLMFEPLGYASVEEMIRKGYELEPAEIAVAVKWLQLHPDKAGSLDYVKAMAYQELDAATPDLKTHGGARQGSNTKTVATLPASRGTDYRIARLRRDRPDIHARVLAGELSAHAGMIEAGFRKKREAKRLTVLQRIEKLLPQLTADERAQLCRLLATCSQAEAAE